VNAAGEYLLRAAITSRAADAADLVSLEESGARCDIDLEMVGRHQVATLRGEKDQLMSALEQLSELVQEDVEEPWFAEWAEQRTFASGDAEGSAPSDRARGSRSQKEATSSRPSDSFRGPPQCTIFVGGLSKSTIPAALREHFEQYGEVVEVDVKVDRESKRSKGFGFVTFAEPYMVNNCFDDPQDHIIDGKWVDIKRYDPVAADGGRASDHDREDRFGSRSNSHGAREYGGHGENGHSSADYRGGGPSSGRGRAEYSGRHHEDHQQSSASDEDTRWFCDLAEEVPEDYFEKEYVITCTLPESTCGALIGRKAENIKEVERSSGAEVKAEKRTQDSDYRQFTIQGPLLSVYAAHMLLMHNYNVAEEKHAARQEDRGREQGENSSIEELKRQVELLKAKVEQQTGRY